MMQKIFHFLSRRNWGIIRYNSTFQNLAALMYLVIVWRQFSFIDIGKIFSFFFFSLFMTGYGYFVNDLSDVDLDRLHGKPNAFHNTSRTKSIIIVLSFLLIGLIFAVPFIHHPWFILCLAVWILIVSFYSLPPLRLKEKGLTGLAATIIGQQILPTALLLLSFSPGFDPALIFFLSLSAIRGISSDLSHQIRDWGNDVRTGTQTFVVQFGVLQSNWIYAWCLELERIIFGFTLLAVAVSLPRLDSSWFSIPFSPTWLLFAIFLVLFALTAGRSVRAAKINELHRLDPYDEARQSVKMDALHIIHHTFPVVFFPLWLASIASLLYLPNLLFVVAIIFLYRLYRPELWRRLIPTLRSL